MGSSRATGEGNPVVTAKKIAPWVIEHTANDQQADLLVVLVDHNGIIADPLDAVSARYSCRAAFTI